MGLNLIKSPHHKGDCLHSVYDCLEIVVESTDLVREQGARDRACFQIHTPLAIGDKLIFFEGTSVQITFEVVESSEIGELKCRRLDYICLPQSADVSSQVDLLIEEFSKRPIFANNYTITLIENEGQSPVICIAAKKIGKAITPISFTDKAIDSPSGAVSTDIEGYPNAAGKDIVLLENYETTFYLYCREVSEDGSKQWKQVFQSPPRPYFIDEGGNNFIPYEIQEAAKRLVWSEFQSVPGLHNLGTLVKEVEVRASTKYVLELNGERREIEGNILPLGARFLVVNASLPPWSEGFKRFCDCLGQLDGMDTRFYSMYPDGIEVADCGIIPLQAFVCVPSTGKASGGTTGVWYADIFWKDGTASTSIQLAEIDINESTVLQYNLDLKNDSAITDNSSEVDGCLPAIDYINTYLVVNSEGNPLDFSVHCEYNKGNEDYNIVFKPFGLNGFGDAQLTFEWALSQEGEIWEVFSTSEEATIDMDADEVLARIVRLRVTTPFDGGCVLEVKRDIVAGGCNIWSGFELDVSNTNEASLCPDFEQNKFGVTLQSQADKWVAYFNIGDIVSELNFSNATNIFIQHGVEGNLTDSNTFLLEDIPLGSTIAYQLRISFEYGGNLIVRTFESEYAAPNGSADFEEILPCTDTTGDTGVSIELIDNSLGGSHITSKAHYYAFAPKKWDFESQVLPIMQEHDFSNPLTVSFNSEYLFSSSFVLWIAQVIEGCDDKKRSYRKLSFNCELPQPQFLIAGPCKGLDIEVMVQNPKDGKPARIWTGQVVNPNGHHEIKLYNPNNEVIASIQSTEENLAPILDTDDFDGLTLLAGRYTVEVVTVDNCRIKRLADIAINGECSPPQTVNVIPTKEGKAFIQWSAVESAVYYTVRYKREDAAESAEWKEYRNREWFPLTGGNPNSNNIFIDEKFPNCGLYVFEVRAVCEGDSISAATLSEVTEMYCCDPCIDPCKDCKPTANPPVINPIAPPIVGDFEVFGVMQCPVIPVTGDFEVGATCEQHLQSGDFEVSPTCEQEEIQTTGLFEVKGVCTPDLANCDEDWSVKEV